MKSYLGLISYCMRKFICRGVVEFEIIADDDCSLDEATKSVRVFGGCQSMKCNILSWDVTDSKVEELFEDEHAMSMGSQKLNS